MNSCVFLNSAGIPFFSFYKHISQQSKLNIISIILFKELGTSTSFRLFKPFCDSLHLSQYKIDEIKFGNLGCLNLVDFFLFLIRVALKTEKC